MILWLCLRAIVMKKPINKYKKRKTVTEMFAAHNKELRTDLKDLQRREALIQFELDWYKATAIDLASELLNQNAALAWYKEKAEKLAKQSLKAKTE